MNFEEAIDTYFALRTCAYQYMRDNVDETLGVNGYSWLRYAVSASDIQMGTDDNSLSCWGHCYSQQTMDHEWFEFTIPLTEIDKKMKERGENGL